MRIFGLASVLVVALVANGYGSSAHTAGAKSRVPPNRANVQSDDEAVINAALLSFFEDTAWNIDWNKGDFVIIDPHWAQTSRPDFLTLLNARIGQIDQESRQGKKWRVLHWEEGKLLRSIRTSIGKASFNGDDLSPLEGLILDPRILPRSAIQFQIRSLLGGSPDTFECAIGRDKAPPSELTLGSSPPPTPLMADTPLSLPECLFG